MGDLLAKFCQVIEQTALLTLNIKHSFSILICMDLHNQEKDLHTCVSCCCPSAVNTTLFQDTNGDIHNLKINCNFER